MIKTNRNNNSLFLSLAHWIFFLLTFTYFAFFANHIFFYQEKTALFIFSGDLLKESLHQPGGLLLYTGKFLTTFSYYPVAGAFITSAIISLVMVITSAIIRFLTGKKAGILPFIIGSVIFYLQTNYQYLLFYNLALLLQLGLFFVTIKYITQMKGWIPFIIFPFWYFATGGFSWVYALMFAIYLILSKEKWAWIKVLMLLILNLLIIFISKEYLFYQTVETLLLFPFSQTDTNSQKRIFLAVASIISLLPILSKINLKLPGKIKASGSLVGIMTLTLPVILITLIGIHQFDKKYQQYFYVEKLFCQKKYNAVIAYNTTHPTMNSMTIFLNNIALCETGKLNDLLFHFPQNPDGHTLFLKWEMVGEILRRGGYFYYTIGMINEAHRWAFENMVMKGHTPEGLKMLIKTELINGNYQMAAKYVAILKKTFFYRHEAKQYERLLFNDEAVESHQELGEKRKIRVKSDFFIIPEDPYVNLERILAGDTLNRKAFEYKIAFLLLKKDSKGIVAVLPKLEGYGFTKIPTHLEEAVAAYKLLNIGPLPKPGNLRIDPQTELRLTHFFQTLQFYDNDLKAAEPALRKKFGNTFWYYVFYR
jgi:hypothetical protein